jgi:hypothetical protein
MWYVILSEFFQNTEKKNVYTLNFFYICIQGKKCIGMSIPASLLVFCILRFELKAYTLSYSTSPFFVKGF